MHSNDDEIYGNELQGAEEWLCQECMNKTMTPEEYKILFDVGFEAVKAKRKAVEETTDYYNDLAREKA